ncbi:hypothetical protein EVAR_43261_1 [Eumeta japonica]|uniref:Uncharacterized protein n=1 Tax=Eumeta variegata TaxID=151549 RepID=A0A4C1WRW6_EUMVA|nr:hypothetical protein EVAR_43261_1 [Eumeta japonica]
MTTVMNHGAWHSRDRRIMLARPDARAPRPLPVCTYLSGSDYNNYVDGLSPPDGNQVINRAAAAPAPRPAPRAPRTLRDVSSELRLHISCLFVKS